jgi:hypothetical protein
MNNIQKARFAESTDNYVTSFVLFIFLTGLNAGSHVLQFYFSRTEFPVIGFLHLGISVSMLLGFVWLMWCFLQFARLKDCSTSTTSLLMESFTTRTNMLALASSWAFSFFTAQFLGEWQEADVLWFGSHELAGLQPTRFYLYLQVSLMCLSYSLAFFILYRSEEEDSSGDLP